MMMNDSFCKIGSRTLLALKLVQICTHFSTLKNIYINININMRYKDISKLFSIITANGLLYFAEIVSCARRALARILVVIVSIGFGIVKPRLGQTLHKVMIVGGAYFILASVEACMRVRDENYFMGMTNKKMFALAPLAVLEVSIYCWIFKSVVQTTRTLRIRKNIIKLTLYRHFTNTLIFTVLASLAYMWIEEKIFNDCVPVTTFWLNEALCPVLFALILAVIMILWKPSINNQRYAFTPLDMDMDNEDEDDLTLSDAFG
ncbi:transmembrane protein 87A-like isoform X2 [Clytia hemisphaerica]